MDPRRARSRPASYQRLVNGDYGTGDTPVGPGDRIDVLPAISGGREPDDRAARGHPEGPVRSRRRSWRAVRGDGTGVRGGAGRVRDARPAHRAPARVREVRVLRPEALVRG
ncbi:MAG: MoaD/ThiS family protein [Solirubrobacterales bacterium]|nr:MoaD/ThiS family protein [Solirubrobacterales bacterium]